MTQILVYQFQEGIVLASDSRAVLYSSGDEADRRFVDVKKFFQLGSHTVAVAAGAGYGTLLCERLERHLLEMDLDHFGTIVEEAPRFLQVQLEKLRREQTTGLIPAQLNRFYIVIAGHAPGDARNPFQFRLLGAEGPQDRVHVIPAGHLLAIPRHLGVETRLARFRPAHGTLDEIESLLEELLLEMAKKNEEIGPPFHFIRVHREGISMRTRWR